MQIVHFDGIPAIITALQHHQNQPMVRPRHPLPPLRAHEG